jgi:hypothetical protein
MNKKEFVVKIVYLNKFFQQEAPVASLVYIASAIMRRPSRK